MKNVQTLATLSMVIGISAALCLPAAHAQNAAQKTYQAKCVACHAADGSGTVHFAPAVREVPGLLERPDGNNVNLDREGLLLAESQLQYQLGVQLIKDQFH